VVNILMPDNSGIIHQNIDPPEFIDCLLNDGGGTAFGGNAGMVGGRNASGFAYFFHHLIRGARGSAMAVMRCSQVIDHHACSLRGKADGIRPSQPVSRTRNYGHSSLQHFSHAHPLSH
jgi:hypothetical protein